MKEAVYSFSNSAGDKFYLRLAADSDLPVGGIKKPPEN